MLGALTLNLLGELTRNLFGSLPGINMVIYGSLLIVIVMFAPRGVLGLGQSVRRLWSRAARAASDAAPEAKHG